MRIQFSYNSHNYLMDIALENINSGQRQRFNGPPGQRNPAAMGNMRGPPNSLPHQNFDGNQYQQGNRPNNPRYTSPNNPPQNNYRSPPQRQNYREDQQQQQPSRPQYNNNPNPNYQQDHPPQQRQNPPRFPPPPQREHRSQPRQDHSEERNEPTNRNQNMPHHYQKQRNYEQEQPRFEKRQPYNRDEGNEDRERQQDGGPYRQNVNPRYRGNQQNDRGYNQQNQRSHPQQNDRNYQGRNQFRQPNNMQRGEQYDGERGRGRGRGGDRGGDRGRGRGRGRGRQISRAIQQSEFNSLPPLKKPQEKAEQAQEQSGSESGSQQMSREDESRSASNESQSKAMEESEVEDHSESNGSVEENSAPEGEEESRSQAIESEEPAARMVARQQSESQRSLNMQQIHTMCSKDEFNQRLETFTTNNRNLEGNMVRLDTGRSFAIFEINKKTGEPDYALTLKRYRRSTNRAEDQDDKDEESDMPRSRAGLMMAIKHIHKEIIDADNVKERELAFPFPPGENRIQFLHIFDFLWNRMREMIKDVSRLDMKDRSSAEIIIMCEQMLRFFIVAIREGKLPHNCRLQFDPKLNLESITKILTQLLEIYEESHMKLHKDGSASIFISPNEPEIIGYAIIISNDIQRTLNEKLMIRLNGSGLEHPLLSSKEIQNALRIKKALKNRDYETFYDILQDQNTDYVLSCLMMHHLPIVRRETLRTIYRSSFTDPMTKSKRLSEEVFRQALRFKTKQHREFKEFVKDIRATVSNENGESFIYLGQIEDNFDENHLASSYIFESNKLLRSLFDLKPCTKRLSNPNLMSREELTKRSWFTGNYAQLAKRYYNPGGEEEDELSESEQARPKAVPAEKQHKKQSQSLPVPEKMSPASPIPQVDGNKINLLMLKRKELERNKFLKSLQGLIQNLIKNSDIHSQHKRKKGLQTMLELTDLSRVLVLESAFTRIAQYASSKRTAEQALRELEKYRKVKEEFEGIYNRSTFEFGRRDRPVQVKMSQLLNQGRRPKEQNVLKKLFMVYKEAEPTGRRRLRTLYIFTTEKKNLSEGQKAFLTNFYSYISMGSKRTEIQSQVIINRLLDVSCDNWVQFQKSMVKTEQSNIISLDYSFTLLNYRAGSNCEIPFLSGYDAVVFIDLWKSVSAFASLIKDFQEGRRKILHNENRPVPPNTQSYLVLHIGSTEGNWQSGNLPEYYKQTSKKEVQWENSWQRLESEAIKISPCLKITMLSFLSAKLREPEQQHPELAIYSLSALIDQVERNLECVSGEDLKRDVKSLQFLEAYFNESLDCIRRAVLATAVNYESFDWKEILQEAIYSKPGPSKYLTFQTPPDVVFHEERLNLNHQLHKKFTFSLELISSLKLTLSSAYATARRQRMEEGLYLLSQLAENYLQGLCKQEIEEYFSCLVAYVVQTNCHMVLTDTISGDCKNLFHFLLTKIKQKLKFCNVILPRGFEFKISRHALMQKEKRVQQAIPSPLPSMRTEARTRKNLSYCRSAILNQLLQEIEQGEQEEDEVVEVKPLGSKAIKMR